MVSSVLIAAGVAAVLYGAVVLGFYAAQRTMMYPAPRGYVPPEAVGLESVRVATLPTEDGAELTVWWSPPPRPDAPVALYFHGNAERLSDLDARIAALGRDGFGVAAMAYRGYPGSSGKPSEAALLADAERLHDWVQEAGVAPERMVSMGYSLGSGVAVGLAAARPVGGLVLFAPFTSAADIAKKAYPWLPVRALMLDPMRSDARIARVRAPIAIVHGTADDIVPYGFGRRLFDLAPEPKRLVTIEGADHFLAADAGREPVVRFLARHMGPAVRFPTAEALASRSDEHAAATVVDEVER